MHNFFYYEQTPFQMPECFSDTCSAIYDTSNYGKEVLTMKITLNEVLDQKGISQNQMAKDTGISTSTLRNLNHNRTTRINFDILEKICTYLDCKIEDILSLEKEPA